MNEPQKRYYTKCKIPYTHTHKKKTHCIIVYVIYSEKENLQSESRLFEAGVGTEINYKQAQRDLMEML